MLQRTRACLLLSMLVLAPCSSVAASAHADALARIGNLIAKHYVDEARGRELAAALRQAERNGDFDGARRADEFAGAVTRWLQPHDRHFAVFHAAEAASAGTIAHGGDDWADRSRRQNFGFRRVERWPGNIGYLDLRYFEAPSLGAAAATAAMQFLSGSDAVIIDLRQNGGGEPGMVQLLCSYFFPDAPRVLLNSLYWRQGDVTHQFWTLPAVAGPRMPDVPLYVLISARTGSAAEEFAYNMRTQQRARLIGETTAGAANPGDVFAAGDGFSIFISTGKAVNPVTGDNWEGRGVTPHREVAAGEAKRVAYEEALEALTALADNAAWKRELAFASEAVAIRRTPLTLDEEQLAAFAGAFGSRHVERQRGELLFTRERRPPRVMRALGDDRFLLDGVEDRRIEFERDSSGAVVRLVEVFTDGHREVHARN